MRALKAAVIIMGVLIVLGVVTLGVALTQRLSGQAGPMASTVLDEPAGSRIVGVSVGTDRMAVQVQGAGPDRIVLVDSKSGRVVGRVGLAR